MLLREQRRSPCTLAGRELWRPWSFLSAKWIPPHPSLAGDNGDSPGPFQDEVWGPLWPCWSIRVWDTGFADSWGLERGGLKIERWVSVGRKASLEAVGVGWGENALDRWLSRLGNRRAPLQTRVSALYPHSHVLFSLSPSQTLLCLLKEMAPTFKDTGAAVW